MGRETENKREKERERRRERMKGERLISSKEKEKKRAAIPFICTHPVEQNSTMIVIYIGIGD